MVFTNKMFEKHRHLYLKCPSSTDVFKHFGNKNQLPGFYISRTLVENGLMKIVKFWFKLILSQTSGFIQSTFYVRCKVKILNLQKKKKKIYCANKSRLKSQVIGKRGRTAITKQKIFV